MRHGVSVSLSFCFPLKQTFLDGRCRVGSVVLVNSLTCGRVPLTAHSHSHTDTHASHTALFQLECLKQTSKAVSKATGAKKKVREWNAAAHVHSSTPTVMCDSILHSSVTQLPVTHSPAEQQCSMHFHHT